MPRVTPGGLCIYGGLCGWTLALAHGRGSDEAAIAAYLGRSDAFDDRSLHGHAHCLVDSGHAGTSNRSPCSWPPTLTPPEDPNVPPLTASDEVVLVPT